MSGKMSVEEYARLWLSSDGTLSGARKVAALVRASNEPQDEIDTWDAIVAEVERLTRAASDLTDLPFGGAK